MTTAASHNQGWHGGSKCNKHTQLSLFWYSFLCEHPNLPIIKYTCGEGSWISGGRICLDFWTAFSVFIVNCYCIKFQATFTETVSVLITSCTCGAELCHTTPHPLSEVTNILHPLALVILTSSQICSHWLTQSQKEADIYYLFIIGWHTIYFSSYWLNILN